MQPQRRAKIVATLGPATEGEERLAALFEAGVDVVRLNFSHGTHDEHRQRFERVRRVAEAAGRVVAILGDLSGPKIRVGKFPGGSMELAEGAEVVLTAADVPGGDGVIPHTYAPLCQDARPGQAVFFDDGRLRLRILAVGGDAVRARVEVGGTLKDKKGMNLPETQLSTPALTAKDRKDLEFAVGLGVDYLALSFVRHARDLRDAKELAGDTPVIAKIERPEAVADLDAVLDACDGAMVARGDLGVEIGHEKVPGVQKRIIRECIRRSIPVITATQMLDSMIENPAPTRAEVSDVANAVLDGTDAVMLSGETAAGRYPLEAVRMMASIIREIEHSSDLPRFEQALPAVRRRNFSSAIAAASVAVANTLDLAALAVYSESGSSAIDVSALRPTATIVAFSRHPEVLRRLALQWGVLPVFGAWVHGVQAVVEQAEAVLLARLLVRPGDSIAVTFAMVMDEAEEFQTSVLKLHQVRGEKPPPGPC